MESHSLGSDLKYCLMRKRFLDLTYGSVGVGTSADDARITATQEWVGLFTLPYCAARAAAPGGIRLGALRSVPERSGTTRGPSRRVAQGRQHTKSMDPGRREDGAGARKLGEIGVLDAKVNISDGHVTSECRVNGERNTAACERITALPWPAGKYMYKQTFTYRAATP